MSTSFNDQLERMKALMTYGAVNEDAKHISSYNIEYKAKAADGRYYGIIRENSKYFVKVATPGKEMIAEDYQYIGGITNKANYEYNSYANALKQFELKLGSINEAYDEDRKVNVEVLDPYKKEDLVIEGTENMKNELARQRQIMRNASVIMNEQTEIGTTPFKSQPEAPKADSGDKDYPFTKEGKAEEDRGAIKFGEGSPEKHSATFGPDSNDVEALGKGKDTTVKGSVASEHPNGGKVARVNESMEECGVNGLFNEEGDEDFDMNGETSELEGEISDEPIDTDSLESVGPEELGDEEGMEDEPELGSDGDELGDEEEGMSDLDAQISDLESQLADLKAQRDGEVAGGEDEFGDGDDLGLDDEDDEFDFDDDEDSDLDDEEELGDDEDLDLGDEEDEYLGDEEADEDGELDAEEDPEIELDENIVKNFRKLVRESINEMFDESLGAEYPEYDWEDDPNGEGLFGNDEDEFDHFGEEADDEIGDEMPIGPMSESKSAKLNSIVESVVNDILNERRETHVTINIGNGSNRGNNKKNKKNSDNGDDRNKTNVDADVDAKLEESRINEDELHVFGDHPGYRKKPMTLPQTGEDKFQDNRDWNDDSVHSEEPFGKGKGDSTPFDQLVAQITDSVMKQINENKKKVK